MLCEIIPFFVDNNYSIFNAIVQKRIIFYYTISKQLEVKYSIYQVNWDNPVFNTNNPHPAYFDFFKNKVGCFRFNLILSPAGGSNQTSFLTLQVILHGSPTLRALS